MADYVLNNGYLEKCDLEGDTFVIPEGTTSISHFCLSDEDKRKVKCLKILSAEISSKEFYGMSFPNLEEVDIGMSECSMFIKEIAHKLKRVKVNENNKMFAIINSCLINKIDKVLYTVFDENFAIPDCVEHIDRNAFNKDLNFEELIVPSSVKYETRFENLQKVKKIVFEGVCGACFFTNNPELESIVVKGSLNPFLHNHYELFTFAKSPKIKSFNVAGEELFFIKDNCVCFKKPMSKDVYLVKAYEGFKIPEEVTGLNEGFLPNDFTGELVLPDSILYFNGKVFQYSNITKINLPKHLKEIGDSCFAYCRELKTVVFNDELEIIGDKAFQFCPNLVDLEIKGNLKKIRDYAFDNHQANIVIHISDNLKVVSNSALPFDRIKAVYYHGDKESLLNNKFFAVYNKKSKKKNASFYYLNSKGDFELLDLFAEASNINGASNKGNNHIVIKDNNQNGFVLDKDGKLVSFDEQSDTLAIPPEVKGIPARVFSNRGFKNLYIGKTLSSISNGAFLYSFSIENLYFDGDLNDFQKLTFEKYGGRTEFLKNVKHVYLKDGENYYERIRKVKSIATKGLDIDLVNALLTCNNALVKKTCKSRLASLANEFNTYVSYVDSQPKVVAECQFFALDNKLKETLIDNKISFCMDDLIVDYAIERDTPINLLYFDKETPFKDNYGSSDIKGNKLIKFNIDLNSFDEWEKEFPTVVMSIKNDINTIEKGAFSDISYLFINYEGTVKEWLSIQNNEDLYRCVTLVRCNDGTIQYLKISHLKCKEKLYYGYAHLGSQYKYSAQFAINKKDFWDFIRLVHLTIISSGYYTTLPLHSFDKDDSAVCILDRHNFDSIYLVDVEAG